MTGSVSSWFGSIFLRLSFVATVAGNPVGVLVLGNDAVRTGRRVELIFFQTLVLSCAVLLSVANSVETGLIVDQHRSSIVEVGGLPAHEADLYIVEFLVNS